MTNNTLQEKIKRLIKVSYSKGYETAQANAIVPDKANPDIAADIFLHELMEDPYIAEIIESL